MTITCYNPSMAMEQASKPANGDDSLVEEIVSFGRALRFYRDRSGLTQVELAEMVPMRSTTLSNWEGRAEPPADFYAVSTIAKILKVDAQDLMAGRIWRPKVTVEPVNALTQLAIDLSRKYKGRVTPEEALEVISGYLDLGEDERQHVRNQIGLLRRIPRTPPKPPTNDAGGRD